MIGREQIAALRLRDGSQEILPVIGEERGCALLIIPEDFVAAEREDAADDERGDPLRMCLRISQRQRRAPGAAEDEPLFGAGHLPEPLDVADRCQVVFASRPAWGVERPQPR
jgi:hypothetical protein